MSTYLVLKTVHVLGAILLLGNIVVTGWWKLMANRTGHPEIIAFAQRQVTLTDFLFTAGGSILVFGTGIANVLLHDIPLLETGWLLWALIMFTVSGIVWGSILIPIQIKQAQAAREFPTDEVIPASYWRRERMWFGYGAIAIITPFISLALMVLKPF
jgi:uncharacterized membrane protein